MQLARSNNYLKRKNKKTPEAFLAQPGPTLIQLISIKCCHMPGLMLRASHSMVHKICGIANLKELPVQREYMLD